MKKENKKIELMAPAGSFSTLVTACKAGADAVYFGIDTFSMRSGRSNFHVSHISKIREICDSYPRKPKVYLTLNTIIYDSEKRKLERIIKKVKNYVHGIIVSDFAAIGFCKKYRVPFFISTQMSVANKTSAEFFKKEGAKRVVLARELNLKQVKEIAKIKNLETEVFIHGAMCVAVSGRCFTSQFLFNRSANRGECLHPCRRRYIVKEKETGYELELYKNTVMSAKDLCTLPLIKSLKKSGVSAFKIEGRNRDERYVRETVMAYRKVIDENLTNEEIFSLLKNLEKVFNRGFSTGFYLGKPLHYDFTSVENSASLFCREYIGKTTNFYSKKGVLLVKLVKNLSVGEKIAVIHKKEGVEEMVVESMEKEKRFCKKAGKGEEVGIKVSFQGKKNMEVYKIIKREI